MTQAAGHDRRETSLTELAIDDPSVAYPLIRHMAISQHPALVDQCMTVYCS